MQLPMTLKRVQREDALDVLKSEDRAVAEIFRLFFTTRASAVSEREQHGNLGKQLIRRMGVREAARDHLSEALAATPLLEVSARLLVNTTSRRQALDQVEAMSRGIQGIYLNTHQDFDGAVAALRDIVQPEIKWELDEAIPLVESTLSVEQRAQMFRSARYLRKHAPTRLDPLGPKWYEHAHVFSRVLTIRDHLRDFPRANRGHRA
jgi:hypothetical protein